MRGANNLSRWFLILMVALTVTSLMACEDEEDPRTWVKKLTNDARRPGATARLHQMFDSRMSTAHPPNNPHDATVRQFLDVALEPLVTSFNAHADDTVSRREAIEVIAQSHDPRALPALINALTFRPGNGDSERVALRSVQAIKEMAGAQGEIPDAQKSQVVQALIGTIDRASANSGNQLQIRYNAIQALGAMHATAAVDTLVRLLNRPLADQDISTARGAADALGQIGDPRGVDALIYGLYLRIHAQEAFPYCERALARIGAAAAVPRLISTLNGENRAVETLVAQYANTPGADPVPPGLVKLRASAILAAFAAPESTDALLTILNNRTEVDSVRAAAAEALSYIAVNSAAQRPRIVQALTAVFNENQPDHLPEDHGWSALLVAPALSIIGDPSSTTVILSALNNRVIQPDEYMNVRAQLLGNYAMLARHADVATFTQIANAIRTQLAARVSHAAADEREDMERDAETLRHALDNEALVAGVAGDCNDGDLTCYGNKLRDSHPDVARKAAYMIARTAPADQQANARTILLTQLPNTSSNDVRRSMLIAIGSLAPGGCADCITRLQQMMTAEASQESRLQSHLEAELLISRLHSRQGGS